MEELGHSTTELQQDSNLPTCGCQEFDTIARLETQVIAVHLGVLDAEVKRSSFKYAYACLHSCPFWCELSHTFHPCVALTCSSSLVIHSWGLL
eukprot:4830633-Amphidinium_carterae.2